MHMPIVVPQTPSHQPVVYPFPAIEEQPPESESRTETQASTVIAGVSSSVSPGTSM